MATTKRVSNGAKTIGVMELYGSRDSIFWFRVNELENSHKPHFKWGDNQH